MFSDLLASILRLIIKNNMYIATGNYSDISNLAIILTINLHPVGKP